MRKKQYLTNPKTAVKNFKVEDFSLITDCFTNVVLSDKVEATDMTLDSICEISETLVKSYYIGNRFFAFMKNDYIYEFYNHRLNPICTNATLPLMIDVLIDGKKEILIIEKQSASILKKDITFSFPFGTAIAKYDGRIFVANGQNIYFSNIFNFTEYSTNIENAGFLSVNDEDGSVLELIEFGNCLFVICKKAIYKLTISNQCDFTFSKCELDYLDILQESVKKVGNSIYFISQSKLCEFNGSSFKRISGEFDRHLKTATGSATTTEGLYSIKILIKSTEIFFVYNTFTGKHHYVCEDGGGSMGENGYVFIREYGMLKKITSNNILHLFNWESKEIDFSSPNKKTLLELRIKTKEELILTIQGDFGKKELHLVEGDNIKKFNLTSKSFKFSASLEANDFLIEDMNFKYSILGE